MIYRHLNTSPPNRIYRRWFFCFFLITIFSPLVAQVNPAAWPDQLGMNYTPRSAQFGPVAFMSDLGAWFGFALPSVDRPDRYGSFSGPWLMNDQPGWVSDGLVRFSLLDEKGRKPIGVTAFGAHGYPGRLEQSMKYGDIQARLELVFVSSTTALIRVTLINTGTLTARVTPVWNGSLFAGTLQADLRDDGFWLGNSSRSRIITLRTPSEVMVNRANDTLFSLKNEVLSLDAKGFKKYYMAVSFFMSADEAEQGLFAVNELLENPDALFDKGERRWRDYLRLALTRLRPGDDSLAAPGIVVKSIQTLTTNWRRKGGTLRHDGIFPSAFYKGFYGFWAWDSWKQAAACAWFNPPLAKEQVRLMLSRQDSAGMVPDVIYADPAADNFRNTKPPLAAWAVNEIQEATGDVAFVAEVLPALLRDHYWWYNHRDADGNGLCAWGSTDGTLEAARWESGMDNAIRFDEATLVSSGAGGWNMTQESPDLNAFLYAEKLHLARLCRLYGQPADADRLTADATRLRNLINSELWNKATGFYHDRITGHGSFVAVAGPEGWIPLWAGVADTTQAVAVAAVIAKPDRFRSLMPFPTVETGATGFSPDKGYWRGPVWIDQAHFALSGLRRYGLSQQAQDLQHQLLTSQSGIADKGVPLYENYNPLTASGLNATHFSWTAAHLILLLTGR